MQSSVKEAVIPSRVELGVFQVNFPVSGFHLLRGFFKNCGFVEHNHIFICIVFIVFYYFIGAFLRDFTLQIWAKVTCTGVPIGSLASHPHEPAPGMCQVLFASDTTCIPRFTGLPVSETWHRF